LLTFFENKNKNKIIIFCVVFEIPQSLVLHLKVELGTVYNCTGTRGASKKKCLISYIGLSIPGPALPSPLPADPSNVFALNKWRMKKKKKCSACSSFAFFVTCVWSRYKYVQTP
jgi:hypothetical protein